MASPKVVSFYYDVEGSFYSDKAKELKANCEALGIEYIIEERKFGDRWIDNVRAKPLFIRDMLNQLEEPFIFIDVDCKILKKPDFKFTKEWGFLYRDDEFKVEDYVHYVNSPQFINTWIDEIKKQGRGSHSCLRDIISKVSHAKLPGGYFELGISPTSDKNL